MKITKVFTALGLIAALTVAACGPSPQQQQQAAYQAGVQAGQQQSTQYQQAAAPTQQQAYNSVQECQSDPNNPNPNLCAQSFTQAQAALPHYYSASACGALYSDCHDYGGWFGPAFAGFMLGSYLNGGYHPYPLYLGAGGYLYGNGYSLGYRPVRSYYGGYYHYGSPAHTVVVIHSTPSSAYRSAVPSSAYHTVVRAPAPAIQRGGFGNTQAQAGFTQSRPTTVAAAAPPPIHTASAAAAAPAFHPTAAPAAFHTAPSAPRASGGFGGGSGGFRSGGSSSRRH
jgi:hypothetical protein